mgnify:CR=1 FL=1
MSSGSGKFVVGVDEAGRGPLAGPVAVGIILVAEDFDLLAEFPGLNDSKKLTEKARERIFEQVINLAEEGNEIQFSVELGSAKEIDEEGIAVVIKRLVATGIEKLFPNPGDGKVWLDGSLSAPVVYEQETVIGGDGKVPAIMLASVMAKVTRDRLMIELAQTYPEYELERHKGYGTKVHMEKLREHGLSDIHRRTFIHLD